MRKKWWLFLLVIVIFLGLRFFRLEETVNFSADQGTSLLRAREIWDYKELTLLGPTASPTVEGRQFFMGSFIYYFLVGLMLVSKWDPLIASGWMIGLNLIGLFFIWKMYKKAIIPAIFMPVSIYFSKFIWNPNVLLILAPIYWWGLWRLNGFNPSPAVAGPPLDPPEAGRQEGTEKRKTKVWEYGAIGILAGIMFQFHFQIGPVIVLTLLWLVLSKKGWKNIIIFLIGAGVGYAPLILFDLRNNFYNIKTILLWIFKGGDKRSDMQVYYFLVWLPLLWVWGAKLIEKLSYKNWIWGGLIVASLGWVFLTKSTEDMPINWNYIKLKETKNIILKDNPKNFNVVNKLSGDTQFNSLRYFLKINNNEAMPINKYPEATILYVVANNDWKIDDQVWEVASFKPVKIDTSWDLGEEIKLYKLEK